MSKPPVGYYPTLQARDKQIEDQFDYLSRLIKIDTAKARAIQQAEYDRKMGIQPTPLPTLLPEEKIVEDNDQLNAMLKIVNSLLSASDAKYFSNELIKRGDVKLFNQFSKEFVEGIKPRLKFMTRLDVLYFWEALKKRMTGEDIKYILNEIIKAIKSSRLSPTEKQTAETLAEASADLENREALDKIQETIQQEKPVEQLVDNMTNNLIKNIDEAEEKGDLSEEQADLARNQVEQSRLMGDVKGLTDISRAVGDLTLDDVREQIKRDTSSLSDKAEWLLGVILKKISDYDEGDLSKEELQYTFNEVDNELKKAYKGFKVSELPDKTKAIRKAIMYLKKAFEKENLDILKQETERAISLLRGETAIIQTTADVISDDLYNSQTGSGLNQVDKMKTRFDMLRGEIIAGNDSPLLLRELKGLIRIMGDYIKDDEKLMLMGLLRRLN